MTDLCQCVSERCTVKADCLRFTKQPNFRQSYADLWTYDEQERCGYFVPIPSERRAALPQPGTPDSKT